MFGRQYAHHLDLLMHSFTEMNKDYRHRSKEKTHTPLIEKWKQLYVFFFGIPEIGFQVRSIYFKKILDTFIRDKKPISILDAGSGIGAYSFWLAKKYPQASVTGGDIDRHKLKACTALAKEFHISNVSFRPLDITKAHGKDVYSLIVSIDVLEHIEDYTNVLRNFHRLLRKNGLLYIHVPQPNQQRIFRALRQWHHEDHVREGISKVELENVLFTIGFTMIVSRETFGWFGKLAWELNHMMLSKSFILAGIIYPFLYIIAMLDLLSQHKNGLGIAVLSKKL